MRQETFTREEGQAAVSRRHGSARHLGPAGAVVQSDVSVHRSRRQALELVHELENEEQIARGQEITRLRFGSYRPFTPFSSPTHPHADIVFNFPDAWGQEDLMALACALMAIASCSVSRKSPWHDPLTNLTPELAAKAKGFLDEAYFVGANLH